jgi:N-acetylmuramoyl-L-alanine amidase
MIFLLAGHGGGDSGAVGVNGRTESAETIKLRDKIKAHLQSLGAQFKTDDDRDGLATVLNKLQTGSGSVVLDIHFNASSNATATGVEVLVGDDAQGNDLALAMDVLDVMIKYTGLKSRGVKKESQTPRKRLGVMREHGSVCLLEVCFISNASDMKKYDNVVSEIARELSSVLIRHDAKA